ncbi:MULTISPECIES: ATP-binding cassette domain-containing protein [Nocardiopsis]|uniref:ABC transporter domain-containing protein n=1 Tax=Nocardiopsis sinuspersici TaxID=501010 RepID=A0A1V3C7J7_9ACTN|nr:MULTISPECIES: ABC transporter ATP-binding protein [Nocardiopsis]OOC56673.1 hypothetical protein NOSIN_24915 [Nocardiopsis sinuspersici]
MGFLRNWPLLLRALGPAGPVLVASLAAVRFLERLVPAVTALALAALVGVLAPPATPGTFTAALPPILVLGLVVLGGHAGEAAAAPLEYLARSRIDGAHRERIGRAVSGSRGIAALEDTANQVLLRQVRADPEHGVESTPGSGAVAALRWTCGLAGAVVTCAILARFAWWLVPVVLVPAAAHRYLRHRWSLTGADRWRTAIRGELHADVWRGASVSPSEGKDVRVFGIGDWMVDRMQGHLVEANKPLWSHIDRTLRLQWSPLLLVLAGLVPAYLLVTHGAVSGTTTVTVQTAVLAAGWSLYQALGGSADLFHMAGAARVLSSTAELRGRLAEGGRTATGGGGAADGSAPPRGRGPSRVSVIRFEDVSFTYPGTDSPVLDGVDLEIRTDELLAVVGLNGAGKSTLIKLLCGLYRPTSGRVTADGVDVATMAAGQWRSRLAVVFQDFNRYELSARENVLLGRAGPPDREALDAAAEESGFAGVLERLPRGWDTPLSRGRAGGVDLSGGQWQQLVLARALYAVLGGDVPASLLVADEPTAHLDVRTEFALFRRLEERRRETGIVLVSHRLSTVRRADRIVLLDGGRVTESGTHEELVALGGRYARMFAVQAERFRTDRTAPREGGPA